MENSEDPGIRRKGAQPGNNNAIKNGFYARCFKRRDITDLQKHDFEGLKDEIELFRVQIRRISEMSADIKNLQEALDYLNCFSHAFHSLSRLVRTNYFVFNDQDDFKSEIMKAVNEARLELEAEGAAKNEPPSLPPA
jgi:hypothetical protein